MLAVCDVAEDLPEGLRRGQALVALTAEEYSHRELRKALELAQQRSQTEYEKTNEKRMFC